MLWMLLACSAPFSSYSTRQGPPEERPPASDSALPPVDTSPPPQDSATDSATDSAPPAETADTGEVITPPAPLRVAVISDLNSSYGSTSYRAEVHAAIDALLADPPDLVLSTGDMVAGQKGGLDYEAMWSAFHAAVSDPLDSAGLPFAVTPGNHDASDYAGYEEEREAYAAAWADRVPAVDMVDGTDFPFRYAFVMGDTLFVSLDDTLVGSLGSEQRAWLSGVLDTPAAVKIVYGHVPLYPVAIGRETEALFDDTLEDLLNDKGVTAFISGHHHAYYPGRRGDLRLVATSCLGDSARELIGTAEDSPRSVLRFVIEGGAITELEAWSGSTFDTVVERDSLPTSVGSGGDVIVRDDQ